MKKIIAILLILLALPIAAIGQDDSPTIAAKKYFKYYISMDARIYQYVCTSGVAPLKQLFAQRRQSGEQAINVNAAMQNYDFQLVQMNGDRALVKTIQRHPYQEFGSQMIKQNGKWKVCN